MHVETDVESLGVQVYPCLEKRGGGGEGRGGCHHRLLMFTLLGTSQA